jgi:hypothetical protein
MIMIMTMMMVRMTPMMKMMIRPTMKNMLAKQRLKSKLCVHTTYWKKKRLVMRRNKQREKKRRAVSNGEPAPQTREAHGSLAGEDVEAVWARDFVLPHVCIDGKFTSHAH